MEQTFDTPALTAPDLATSDLMALRQHLTQRLMAKVTQWVGILDTLPTPTNAAEITRLCRAVSALMGVLNKLVPDPKASGRKAPAQPSAAGDEVSAMLDSLFAELETKSDAETPPGPLNRHQRRKMQKMGRRG